MDSSARPGVTLFNARAIVVWWLVWEQGHVSLSVGLVQSQDPSLAACLLNHFGLHYQGFSSTTTCCIFSSEEETGIYVSTMEKIPIERVRSVWKSFKFFLLSFFEESFEFSHVLVL